MVDDRSMKIRREQTRNEKMIQWVGILITIIGLAYTGVKDYQKGDIKFPPMPQKQVLTKPVYPIQYCVMAYDPNLDKVFYRHEDGIWREFAPTQKRIGEYYR